MITQAEVQYLFIYTGSDLLWLNPRANRNKPGDIAGTISKRGYRRVKLDGKMYMAHHLVWLYHTGHLPSYVDHHNGIPLDNTLSNLRLATHQQNTQNRRANRNSRSKFKGVKWQEKNKKWRAVLRHNGTDYSLGMFRNEEDAARAYDAKAKELHKEFARLNFPEET